MPLIPYEILIRLNSEGKFQGASLKQWDTDRRMETAPEDLGTDSDPRFKAVIGELLTSANAQVVELQAQLATAQTDAAEAPQLRDRIAQLEAELETLRQPPPQPEQDYAGLYNGLLSEGLPIFLFVRYACDQNLPVSNAYTDLVAALVTPQPQFAALQACINNMFGAMSAAGFDFSEGQTAQMRSLLDSYGFQAIAFPLGSEPQL